MKFEDVLPKLRDGRVCLRILDNFSVRYRIHAGKLESCQGFVWDTSNDPCIKFITGNWTVEQEQISFDAAVTQAKIGALVRPVGTTQLFRWGMGGLVTDGIPGTPGRFTTQEIASLWECM